jgi:hypothetical protein
MKRRSFHTPPDGFQLTGSIASFDISGKLDSMVQTKNGIGC